MKPAKIWSTLEGYLSKELQRHYARIGNRILFSNGMTLNQLALEMWEILGFKEVDASVVSRVLKGKRTFSFNQLQVFCRALDLSASEEQKLKTALYRDLHERVGLENICNVADKVFIGLVKENIAKIRELRGRDLMIMVDDWSTFLLESIKDRRKCMIDYPRDRMLLSLYAEILLEKIYALQVIRPKHKSFWPIVYYSRKLINIGQELKDSRYICVANVHIGDIYYINHRYQSAIKHLEQGINLYSDEIREIFPWTPLRPLAISYAYLGNEAEFDCLKRKIIKDLPKFEFGAQCLALEGLTKSEAILGRATEANSYLVSAGSKLSELEKENGSYRKIIEVLLVVGELTAIKHLRKNGSKNYLEKIGKRGIQIAREHHYRRHELEIQNLLNAILN